MKEQPTADPIPETRTLVERLREFASNSQGCEQMHDVAYEAADAIERLTRDFVRVEGMLYATEAERDRLRAALEHIVSCYDAEKRRALTMAPLAIAREALRGADEPGSNSTTSAQVATVLPDETLSAQQGKTHPTPHGGSAGEGRDPFKTSL